MTNIERIADAMATLRRRVGVNPDNDAVEAELGGWPGERRSGESDASKIRAGFEALERAGLLR